MKINSRLAVDRKAWASATPKLVYICLLYAMGSVFFGYDSASFAGVQAFQPFGRQFGSCNATTGRCSLAPKTASLANSLALIGKLVGSIAAGSIVTRLGHKRSMILTCGIQCIGVIIETTSTTIAQYTVGRVFIYTAVGLVENVVPTYQAEVSPAPLRGFFVGSIQLCLTFGSLIAGIVNNEMAKHTDKSGWIIATSIQALPAILILIGIYFTPNSPRWLISRDRSDEARQVLLQIRPRKEAESGVVDLELAAIQEETAARTRVGQNKEPWIKLFQGTNRRRTGIACSIMSIQQLTGVTFSSSYGPTFYRQEGLGQMAFAYAAINNGVSVVTALIGMFILDNFGRRSVTFWGNLGQALFLCLIGGLGAKADRSNSETHGMVASFIIYAAILHMTLGPAAYITAAEVGTSSLREKTMAISTAVNVVVSFVVVFTTPYLLSPAYAGLGPNLGYLWGGFAVLGAVWVWFFMPELRGRSLEETDQMFEAKLPAWRFKKFHTSGLSSDVAKVQNGEASAKETALKDMESASVGDGKAGNRVTVGEHDV